MDLIIELGVAILIVFGMVFMSLKSPIQSQGLALVLSITTFFYAVAGPIYWITIQDSIFLRLDWREHIGPAAIILASSSILLLIFISFFVKAVPVFVEPQRPVLCSSFWKNTISFLGVVSGLYVLILAFVIGINENSKDPFFLIAYQFSDMLIPLALYGFAIAKNVRGKVKFIFSYVVFALLVGFRYKLALFLGPLAVYVFLMAMMESENILNRLKAMSKLILLGIMIIAFLSILTLIRKPFGGVDVSDVGDTDYYDLLYGIFAESNTIFALSTIINEFVSNNIYYYLTPIIDAVLELIPRFIYTDRITGAYLQDVLEKMLVPEALQSGTAYPYVGELLLMGGWLVVPVGSILIAVWYKWCVFKLYCSQITRKTLLMGISLLAVYFGYYFYSRGYFSQSFKGFLFVVFPYIFLCMTSKNKSS